MKQFLQACVIVLGIVNVALFFVWLSIIRVTAMSGAQAKATYYFDQISFQITVLETAVTFIGIILAVLGFFGYQHAIERAEFRADKAAREVVAQLHRDGHLAANSPGISSSAGGLPSAGTFAASKQTREENV